VRPAWFSFGPALAPASFAPEAYAPFNPKQTSLEDFTGEDFSEDLTEDLTEDTSDATRLAADRLTRDLALAPAPH
jgi:hypothetical protein